MCGSVITMLAAMTRLWSGDKAMKRIYWFKICNLISIDQSSKSCTKKKIESIELIADCPSHKSRTSSSDISRVTMATVMHNVHSHLTGD